MALESNPRERDETPSRFPSTPTPVPSSDYSFTLQAIMEMQKAIGGLTQSVSTLTKQSEDQGRKVERISHIIYAAGAVGTIFAGTAVWLLSKIADLIVSVLSSSGALQPN